MESNGAGITQQELELLSELNNVVLWQDEDGPTTVIDMNGKSWKIGTYKKNLYKQRCPIYIDFFDDGV